MSKAYTKPRLLHVCGKPTSPSGQGCRAGGGPLRSTGVM